VANLSKNEYSIGAFFLMMVHVFPKHCYSSYQFDKLQQYVKNIYTSDLLEQYTAKQFLDKLPDGEGVRVTPDIATWDDFCT